MTVALQTANVAAFDGGPNTTQDISITVSAGSDLAIFIVVSNAGFRIDSTPGGGFWNLPTVDGNAVTSVATIADAANNTSHIYRYVGVAAGIRTIRFSVAAYAGVSYVCTAIPASGVDQTTPCGTPVLHSTGTSSSPQSNACTVAAGGVAIAAHGINATSQGLTAGSGQSTLRASVVQGGCQFLHTYKADAAAMAYSWTATSPQNHQVIVPINPSAGGGGGGSADVAAMCTRYGLNARNGFGLRR